MLSRKNSTSWPNSSRKYSETVTPVSPTRKRAPGRLVHLAEDHGRVLEDPGLFHLKVKVVPLAGPLPNPGEDARTLVLKGDVVDELGDKDRLADPGAAEQADLTAPEHRAQEVDDLDPALELLRLGGELVECRRRAVDRPAVSHVLYLASLVNRLTEHVQDASQNSLSDGDRYRASGILHLDATAEAVGAGHGDRADHVVAKELLNFQGQGRLTLRALKRDGKSVEDLRDLLPREPDVYDRPLYLYNLSDAALLVAVATVLPAFLLGVSLAADVSAVLLGHIWNSFYPDSRASAPAADL